MERKQDLEDDLFFNDDLTKLRSNLLYKARKSFKADRLNEAWSYNGNVYVKDAKDENYEVKSESAIDKLSSKRPIGRRRDAGNGATSSLASTTTDPHSSSHTQMDR